MSLATSGRAVLFAGSTVILSLLGLFILQLPFMRGLAVGAIAAVVLVMAAALTLLPAMLGFSGRAIDQLHVPGPPPERGRALAAGLLVPVEPHRPAPPVVAGGAALLCLLVLVIPLFSMRLAFTDAGNDPTSLDHPPGLRPPGQRLRPRVQRPAGRGRLGARRPAGPPSRSLRAKVAATPGVAFATPAQFSASGHDAVIIAYPTTSPQAAQTEALVHTLRNDVIPAATAGTGVAASWAGRRPARSTPPPTCRPGCSGSSAW